MSGKRTPRDQDEWVNVETEGSDGSPEGVAAVLEAVAEKTTTARRSGMVVRMSEHLNTYCKGCDQFSAPHRRRDDGQWVCEDCGHLVKCSDPQWSDNCDGDLTTPHEVKKGLCEGCMAVIDSWSDGGEEDGGLEQTKLVTDGGEQLGVQCDVRDCDNRIVGLDDGLEYSRGTVCQDCIDYQDRHGHWPDEDVEICVQCRIDDGAIDHDCDEFSGDGVLLQPGGTCDYCGFEAAKDGEQDG